MDQLKEFSATHRYDDVAVFQEHWLLWLKLNDTLIQRERTRLKSHGYRGDIHSKMYKSVRYYLKNRSAEAKEPKKRRKYLSLDKDFRTDIDLHIKEVAFTNELKPAHAYNNFISNYRYSSRMEDQIKALVNQGLDEASISKKLMKAYKNRYFGRQKLCKPSKDHTSEI